MKSMLIILVSLILISCAPKIAGKAEEIKSSNPTTVFRTLACKMLEKTKGNKISWRLLEGSDLENGFFSTEVLDGIFFLHESTFRLSQWSTNSESPNPIMAIQSDCQRELYKYLFERMVVLPQNKRHQFLLDLVEEIETK